MRYAWGPWAHRSRTWSVWEGSLEEVIFCETKRGVVIGEAKAGRRIKRGDVRR